MPPPSPGAPPQRVCPHCATLAYSAESHCPFCGRSYKRRVLPAVAAMLLVTAGLRPRRVGGAWEEPRGPPRGGGVGGGGGVPRAGGGAPRGGRARKGFPPPHQKAGHPREGRLGG